MAVPVYESSASSAGNSSSRTISKPSGTTSGDLLVAFIGADQRAITEPAGWTPIGYQNDFLIESGAYYKVAGGSEPASYTWTIGGSAPRHSAGAILRISGAATGQPNVYAAADVNSATTSPTAPTATTTVADTLLLRACLGRSASDDTTVPSGYTQAEFVDATSINASCSVAYKDQTSAGSVGTAAFTFAVSGVYVAWTVAIAPAVAAIDTSVGIASGSSAGPITMSSGALAASVGKASGSVAGPIAASFGALPASVGIASGSSAGPVAASFPTLNMGVGIASGSVVGSPAASSPTLAASVGIASGSAVGGPVVSYGAQPASVGIGSGSLVGPIAMFEGDFGVPGMATAGQWNPRFNINGSLIDEGVDSEWPKANAGKSPVMFPTSGGPRAIPFGTTGYAIDEHFHLLTSLEQATPLELNLQALTEVFSRSVSFDVVKYFYFRVVDDDDSGIVVTLGGASSNAWTNMWSSGVSETFGVYYPVFKTAPVAGWAVTNTNKVLKIAVSADVEQAEIWFGGVSV